ncbi:hypothetical protein [Rhizobium sp. BK251]|uniref:hypothetical protein n=1 Tax=Rhizobium sp. BK251 TaxID=2512125 RepID=UPI0010518E19|nr:hypothetical protein [Rhizobium sp. BK251]TCL73604.1 hypothetical protein EV286_103133 [Rhizobium sp. BK251]
MWEWCRRWLAKRFNVYSAKTDPILLYFLSIIDVRLRWFQSRAGNFDEAKKYILEEVIKRRDRLENSSPGIYTDSEAWTEAYRLERLMALLEPIDNLLYEIRLRLDEASAERVSAEPRLRTALSMAEANAFDNSRSPPELKPDGESMLRALLLEILEKTHWTTQRKFFARPIQISATRKIVWAGVFSFALFVLPYAWIYVDIYISRADQKIPTDFLVGLPFYTALTAGLFGAYFSRLLYIQKNAGNMSVGELKTARELTSIFLRGVVGMCGALVVFFFLRSGMVDGKLFPTFPRLSVMEGKVLLSDAVPGVGNAFGQDVGSVRQILPSPDLALLAIWCFLSGFSERLVPSILSTTEQTLGDAAKGGKK